MWKFFIPFVASRPFIGPFRLHQSTTIGNGVFATVTYSDGQAPYSEEWLLQVHNDIQRIRREEQPSGCDQSRQEATSIWVGVAAESQVTINGVTIGSISVITSQQQHGYIAHLQTPIHINDTICVSPIPTGGFQVIFGPDMYYHYDSYCYRGHCVAGNKISQLDPGQKKDPSRSRGVKQWMLQ
jgi:hypothetical protein